MKNTKKIEAKYVTTFNKRLYQNSRGNPNAIMVNGKEVDLDPDSLVGYQTKDGGKVVVHNKLIVQFGQGEVDANNEGR